MKKRTLYWVDLNDDLIWGIECDDPSITFDGHFIALFPYKDADKGFKVANSIADYLNKYAYKL